MDVEASQDVLIDVFERIENFFRRLEIYTEVPPTLAMTDMMVKIMVEVLDILGTATKEMKESRASKVTLSLGLLEAHVLSEKFLKRVAGITKLEDGLKRLDKMTNEEARMANAEVLKIAHDIDKKVQGVGVQVKVVDNKVEVIEAKVQMVLDGARRTAYNLDDERSSLSVVFDSSGEYLTSSQGRYYESALENGNLLLIHLQVTISRANVNTKVPQSGSVKAASSRNGRCPVPCYGFTGNVRYSYC